MYFIYRGVSVIRMWGIVIRLNMIEQASSEITTNHHNTSLLSFLHYYFRRPVHDLSETCGCSRGTVPVIALQYPLFYPGPIK